MVFFIVFPLEIVLLFFLSRSISKTLSRFLSINILSFLFLPGVIIHELSHMLIAVVLFVRAGNMEFTPKTTSSGLKLGSVEIARTDPIRRAVIGFAPVFMGLVLIISIVYFFTYNFSFFQDKSIYITILAISAIVYLLFAVSNTMFSSKRDMEGTIEIIIALLIIVILLYFLGLRVPLSWVLAVLESNIELFRKASIFLLAPIMIDLAILGTITITQNLKVKSQKYR